MSSLKVLIRPLKAINLIHPKMGALLAAKQARQLTLKVLLHLPIDVVADLSCTIEIHD
jgi:hypothetical protein